MGKEIDGRKAAEIMYGTGAKAMTEKNIHQRIHAIMEDVSYVQKEEKKVNNQYKFVSHDAVTSAVRPAMLKHGVLAIPSYFDISADGNRTNCSMSMTLVNINNPEDKLVIPCAGFGQGIDPQDKGAGKAMSYAYKYALLKIFALETGDDPEKDSVDYAPASKAPKEPSYDVKQEAEKYTKDIWSKPTKDKLSLFWEESDSKNRRGRIKATDINLYNTIIAARDDKLDSFREESN